MKMKWNRKELILETQRRAMHLRKQLNLKLTAPVNVYDLIDNLKDNLKVDVWFKDVSSVEGMYRKGSPSQIVVCSLRPPGRQAFTCAHELGHHVFDHGTKFDDLMENDSNDEEEFIANQFAAFLLMPKSTVGYAFSCRGWVPKSCTPIQVYIVAGWLGVGYETLINHMAASLNLITWNHANNLKKTAPIDIRSEAFGYRIKENLILVDENWVDRAIDVYAGDIIMLPSQTQFDPKGTYAVAKNLDSRSNTTIYQATTQGIGRFYNPENDWAAYLRVSRQAFVGRSIYRHLEEVEDE